MDGVKLKEMIGYKPLQFEIHDKDEKLLKEYKNKANLIDVKFDEIIESENEEEEQISKAKKKP